WLPFSQTWEKGLGDEGIFGLLQEVYFVGMALRSCMRMLNCCRSNKGLRACFKTLSLRFCRALH
ncbi:MAG: hypothetical protein LH702_02550, partial [Phormidesmis sp. CAN_BIN44]|nr:hypothetical protein [Phormidesmis sp. CAN_BIN44]